MKSVTLCQNFLSHAVFGLTAFQRNFCKISQIIIYYPVCTKVPALLGLVYRFEIEDNKIYFYWNNAKTFRIWFHYLWWRFRKTVFYNCWTLTGSPGSCFSQSTCRCGSWSESWNRKAVEDVRGGWSYEALQASASALVSQRWTNFCSMVWKLIWINFGTQSKLRHTAFRISKK